MIYSKNDRALNPLISVVMATYNRERFIEEAIQSVLDQTFTDFEFIIVDDGSTDATAKLIASFKDNRIIYLKKDKNTGIADSLNIGISKAKGKYIARMDDDDVCMLDRFEKQIEILENNKKIIFCGSNVSNNKTKEFKAPEKHEDILIRLMFTNPIFHPTAIIRKEVLLKHKYNPDKVPAEDHDLWSRLIFEGEFYQIQEPLLYVRLHQTSITANRRHEQLQHHIAILKFVYNKLAFNNLVNHEENLSRYASNDYTISGRQLRQLIIWFEELKQANANKKLFPVNNFSNVANVYLKRYLKSYFINTKLLKKITPFLYLNLTYKKYIFKYYFKKLLK